jgi:hypothetical protein
VGNKIPFWKLLAAHIMTPRPFDDHKNNEKKDDTNSSYTFFLKAFSPSFSWTLPKQQKKKPMIFKLQK